MRKASLDAVYKLAKNDERIFFIGSDLGIGTLDEFKREMPERFFMEGVSEANMIGMAAGLALEGKIVYVNTIATFITRRCFEQVALDLCLHDVQVRLIGNGGGMVYAPLGPTHMAIDDFALFRALPKMTILAPCDAEEMRRIVPLTVDHPGPVYIRLAKGGDRVVSRADVPVKIGEAILAREGRDALVVTTGVCLQVALDAAQALAESGIDVAVLHCHTVKPLDSERILQLAAEVPVVVAIEEHSIYGGLGSAVAELLAEASFQTPKKFKRFGIPDVFPDEYGSQASLMKRYSLDAASLAGGIRSFIEASAASTNSTGRI